MSNRTEVQQKKNHAKHIRRRKLVLLACALVCVYFILSIVNIQIEIYKERQKLNDLREQINEQQLQNDELSRIALGDGEEEYIERIAREKLGYAAPDERVFEDLSGS